MVEKIAEGFKKTEFGIIPNDWKFSNWNEVLDGFSSGATPYRAIKSYYIGSVNWITSGELNYNIIYDTLEHISDEARLKTNLKLRPVGTFLMAITGLEAEGTRGSCGIVGNAATTNQSCMAIYGTKNMITDYLFHFYVRYGNELALRYCQGTKQQSYTAKIVKQLPIVYPPNIKEQQAIATALSDIDSLINSLTKLIDKKKNIKQGAMQELLTGKRRLDGFSGDWEEKKLSEVIDCLDNLRVPLNESERANMKGIYPYCGANGIVDLINDYKIDDNIILIAEDGGYFDEYLTRSIAYRVSGKCWVNNHAHILKAKNNMSQDYIFYSLVNKNILNYIASGTRAKLNKSQLFLIPIIVPPTYEEQTAIAQILSDMDEEIEKLNQKLNKYKEIKEGMMQELLTGKRRLI